VLCVFPQLSIEIFLIRGIIDMSLLANSGNGEGNNCKKGQWGAIPTASQGHWVLGLGSRVSVSEFTHVLIVR
jgi:hypothetical protein